MKKILILAVTLTMLGGTELFAYSDVYYIRKTIIQSVQACGPVTVDAAKIDSWGNIGQYSKYTVSSGTTWSQRIKIKGGYDCNGNNLRVLLDKKTERKHHPNGIKYGNTIYHYVEYETYYYTITTGSGSYGGASSGSTTSSSSSAPSGSGSYSSSSYSGDSRASELGSAWAGAAQATKVYDYYDNYRAGGFSLAATVSPTWGENLELRFRYGSSRFGGDVTGMIGYDWINNKNIGETYKLNWSAGIGMYFGGRPNNIYLWDVDLGVKFGKSSKPYNNAWTAMIDLSTTHLVGPEHVIGLIAGAGIGLGGNGKRPDFVWDVRGGIVIYFLQWNWF